MANFYRNAFLIFNPQAGGLTRARGHRITRATELLRSLGHNVTELPTERAHHATELARRAISDSADLVIAAGGDGTINEVANGMIGSETPLAILPAGTANVLAMEMRLHGGIRHAARQLHLMTPRRIAVGVFRPKQGEPRHFLLMAGAGFDADIVRRVRPDLKKRLGKGAYWIASLSRVGARVPQMNVKVNGDHLTTGFAVAARVRNYGGDLEIAREITLFDSDFEIAAFPGESTWPYGFYMGAIVLGAHAKLPNVFIKRSPTMDLTPVNGEPIYVQLDGELAGQLPGRVESVPSALTLLIPRDLPRRYGL
ncbi:MAG TPA: diacylglycerol kinase family protein [Bryobacteraceae bacterium]|nr:diacylglycerol kinase family protein [Bryobacteraceae bacterium]